MWFCSRLCVRGSVCGQLCCSRGGGATVPVPRSLSSSQRDQSGADSWGAVTHPSATCKKSEVCGVFCMHPLGPITFSLINPHEWWRASETSVRTRLSTVGAASDSGVSGAPTPVRGGSWSSQGVSSSTPNPPPVGVSRSIGAGFASSVCLSNSTGSCGRAGSAFLCLLAPLTQAS